MRLPIISAILLLTSSVVMAQEETVTEFAAPDLGTPVCANIFNKTFAPRVFSGYRNLLRPSRYTTFPDANVAAQVWRDSVLAPQVEALATDSLNEVERIMPASYGDLAFVRGEVTPDWLRRAFETDRFQQDFVYRMMLDNPSLIEYAYWDLPVPPRLPEEDFSLRGYLKRLDLPEIEQGMDVVDVSTDTKRINWLHVVNTSLQLSQAYVSGNWYQGGTSYFALLANFLWDVQLNQVYHPNTMFQSTLSYKLAINSTPDDKYHKYSIAQDLFQYNLKAGYKAYKYWYYSFALQYKTQFFNSYPSNSPVRSASFLSPGELNVGLGMTFTKEKANKSVKFTASISPIAYNMRTCIDSKVDHELIAFPVDKKITHDYGSTAELNFYAKFLKNATYTTRLFFFTDYKNCQSDWEHTLNFQFSKLFSTQIYVHMRYDTAADQNIDRKWKKFMLKEILSFGLSYNFSTK